MRPQCIHALIRDIGRALTDQNDCSVFRNLTEFRILAECRRSPDTASSEYLETKTRGEAYPNLRKTYPGSHGLSFANARKTVNFAIID